NPDYVIVGEVRGREAYVMFQGMSSGHPSLSTFHAGSVDSVIKRLTTPPIELSPTLLESLDLIIVMIHAKEKGKSARRIKEIVEIESVDPKTFEVKTNVVFRWNPAFDKYEKINESSKVKKIALLKGADLEKELSEIKRRERFLNWLLENGVKDYDEVAKFIVAYYKEPEKVEEMMKERVKVEYKPKEIERKTFLEMLGYKVIREEHA
ncbi:MAG: ATPase, T2SS/T4P/T4SS family, partial [Candidatus Aenigmatarchaeota archaeon]